MVDQERERVVVEDNRRSSNGWLVGLLIAIILIVLFFVFGGANLFNGANDGADTINVDTPETIQVQPAN